MLYQYDVTGTTKLPLRFMAHLFTAAALKWSTIEKECYALVKAFNTFENLLRGRIFINSRSSALSQIVRLALKRARSDAKTQRRRSKLILPILLNHSQYSKPASSLVSQ